METPVPKIHDKKPAICDLAAGSHFWCSCGYSEKQPFCDGSHRRYGTMPVMLDLDEPKRVALCNCKHTKNPPYCDGSHSSL